MTRLLAAAALALALVPGALAANGGLAPPTPATPSGEAILDVYWVVFAACAVVFVLIETALILFIIRFRRRAHTPAEAEGPQIHGNTRLELIWTAIPALALAAIAVFVFVKTPSVLGASDGGEPLRVRVESHQFYWQYVYPNGVISPDLLRLPVDRPVALELVSLDVNHSWWVPELTGKLDAIPGRTNVLEFTPSRTGTFEGKCAELCGVEHALMRTSVEVLPDQEFEQWLAGGVEDLGEQTWDAVCAKCHGPQGEGDYGPAIASNPAIVSKESLTPLLREGQDQETVPGYMPAVGEGWPERQIDALIEHVEAAVFEGEAPGGG